MLEVLDVALINAALVIPLAVLVYGATRIWRNPHLARVLWLLVLLKLVTPPVVEVPVPWPSADEPVASHNPSRPAIDTVRNKRPAHPAIEPSVAVDTVGADLAAHANARPAESTVRFPPAAGFQRGDVLQSSNVTATWRWWVLAVWLSGSLVWLAIVVSRVARFQRLLNQAAPAAPRLMELVNKLAGELRIRRVPSVLITAARVPPLLWPVGLRPKIVLPRELVDQLSGSQLRDVLAHELAHVARRDDWVRWLELIVGLFYWWHPVRWIAGRQLRGAEEACCDLLVVGRCSAVSPREYAHTLLAIVDFSARASLPRPALGSRMAGSSQLKRRIEMLVSRRLPGRLSTSSKLLLTLAAITILPLSAVAWQAEQPAEATTPPAKEKATNDKQPAGGMRVVADIPAAPYRIAPGDLLEIHSPASSTLPDAPIRGLYLVEPGGSVQLGPHYGRVRLKSQTLDEAEESVENHLREYLQTPAAAITIGDWGGPGQLKLVPISELPYRIAPGDVLQITAPAETSLPDAPIGGLFLVEPSGRVQLGPRYGGRVKLAGRTLEEAQVVLENQLAEFVKSPRVAVTIGGWQMAVAPSEEAPSTTTSGTSKSPTSSDALDKELIAVLREYVTVLEMNHERAKAQFKTGQRTGANMLIAGCELSAARGELAMAEGDIEQALEHYQQGREQAEQLVKTVTMMEQVGKISDETTATKAANILFQAKIKLIEVKRAAAATTARY